MTTPTDPRHYRYEDAWGRVLDVEPGFNDNEHTFVTYEEDGLVRTIVLPAASVRALRDALTACLEVPS